MYNFENDLDKELKFLKFLLESTNNSQSESRSGFLVKRTGRKGDYYYEVDKNRRIVGKPLKSNSPRVIEIKNQRKQKVLIRRLKNNINCLEKALEKIQSIHPKDINASLPLAYRDSEFGNHILENEAATLMPSIEANISQNSTYPFAVQNITIDGRIVRSLAEVIIYNLLKFHGIKFDYERKITVATEDGYKKELIPDFTIFTPTGEVKYWEHVGRFDDIEYRKRFFDKIVIYYRNGIVPGENLILTFSKKDYSVDSSEINRIIESLL